MGRIYHKKEKWIVLIVSLGLFLGLVTACVPGNSNEKNSENKEEVSSEKIEEISSSEEVSVPEDTESVAEEKVKEFSWIYLKDIDWESFEEKLRDDEREALQKYLHEEDIGLVDYGEFFIDGEKQSEEVYQAWEKENVKEEVEWYLP